MPKSPPTQAAQRIANKGIQQFFHAPQLTTSHRPPTLSHISTALQLPSQPTSPSTARTTDMPPRDSPPRNPDHRRDYQRRDTRDTRDARPRRDRSTSRERGGRGPPRRGGYDHSNNNHSHHNSRTHNRSRSPIRNARRSPPRQRSPRLSHSHQSHSSQHAPGKRNQAPPSRDDKRKVKAEDNQQQQIPEDEDEESAMKRLMGFAGFRSTKNTKVPGNDQLYGVRKDKQTQYRQYMNRVGGFNRPLSPTRM